MSEDCEICNSDFYEYDKNKNNLHNNYNLDGRSHFYIKVPFNINNTEQYCLRELKRLKERDNNKDFQIYNRTLKCVYDRYLKKNIDAYINNNKRDSSLLSLEFKLSFENNNKFIKSLKDLFLTFNLIKK